MDLIVTRYGADGEEVQEEEKALAKKVQGTIIRYYIMYSRAGEGVGRPVNPNQSDFSHSRLDNILPRASYRKVNKDAFEAYVGFLKSGSFPKYRTAERLANN